MKNYLNTFKYLVAFIVIGFSLSNCERDITIDLPDPEEQIVVEGSIETGQAPIVLLNKNFPYFGTFDLESYTKNFVKGATVKVSDGSNEVTLEGKCLSELDNLTDQILFLDKVSQLLGGLPTVEEAPADTSNTGGGIDDLGDFDFCLYSIFSFTPELIGEEGKTYKLNINTTDGEVLNATTSIPNALALDSIWFEQHNNPDYDTLYRLNIQLSDPDTLGNYYRYFTKQNDNPMYAGANSVFDDLYINGLSFPSPLDRAEPRGADFDINTYGYFTFGDEVTLKFVTIDRATYDFWFTLERSANSAGPFGGSTRVNFNIDGGLGIWGGYGVGTLETKIIE